MCHIRIVVEKLVKKYFSKCVFVCVIQATFILFFLTIFPLLCPILFTLLSSPSHSLVCSLDPHRISTSFGLLTPLTPHSYSIFMFYRQLKLNQYVDISLTLPSHPSLPYQLLPAWPAMLVDVPNSGPLFDRYSSVRVLPRLRASLCLLPIPLLLGCHDRIISQAKPESAERSVWRQTSQSSLTPFWK